MSMKITWSILFVLFCLGSAAFGQSNPVLVKLLTELKLAKEDTTRMDAHLQLSNFYITAEANAESALNHANLALILAENNKDKRRELLALDKLVRVFYEVKFDLKQAMAYLNRAKAIDTTVLTIADRGMLFGHEGKLFRALNDFEKSQQAFFNQLTIYEKQHYENGIAQVNCELATLFFDQNDFLQALLYYEKALIRYSALNHIKGKIETLNAIGQTYGKLEDYSKNLSYSTQALTLAKAISDKLQLAHINANIGFSWFHLGELEQALDYFNASLNIGKELENNKIIARAATELGNIYHELCNENEAATYYEKALMAAQETDSKVLVKNVYESLYDFYDEYGQDALAYENLQKLVDLKDELYNEERSTQLIHNQIRYETEKKQEEVNYLKARDLENELTIKNQKLQNYFLLIIAILFISIAITLYHTVKRKRAYNKLLEQEVQKRTNELAKSNSQLKTFNTRLEQSNTELERFAYIASHDLKSPLRNVISFLNLIERKLKNHTDPSLKEYLRYATDNAGHMYNLIQDVLEYSKIDENKSSLSDVDLNESLMLVIQNLKEQIQEKNAEVYVQALPTIQGDSVYILQLFQNLIGNGIKYNQSNQPRVVLNHRVDSMNHVFSIVDNGIGISQNYHEQIFQMFKRLHTKEEYPGTGIGLALCKKIVQNLGGEIWLESKPEKGTTFYISLPKTTAN